MAFTASSRPKFGSRFGNKQLDEAMREATWRLRQDEEDKRAEERAPTGITFPTNDGSCVTPAGQRAIRANPDTPDVSKRLKRVSGVDLSKYFEATFPEHAKLLGKLKNPLYESKGGFFVPLFHRESQRLEWARCTKCPYDAPHYVAVGSRAGTGGMEAHAKSHSAGDVDNSGGGAPTLPVSAEKQKFFDLLMVLMVIRNCLPFSFSDSGSFRDLVDHISPGWKPASRHTVMRRIDSLYDKLVLINARDFAKNCWFSVFIDGWKAPKGRASSNHRHFLGVVIATVDPLFVQRILTVSVKRIRGPHSADNMREMLEALLAGVGVPLTAVANIITDNHATECLVATSLLEKTGGHHSRCYCHTLDLAVDDVFAKVPFAKNILEVSHDCVQLFANHHRLVEALENAQSGVIGGLKRLVSDVETRWNSSLEMMMRLHLLFQYVEAVVTSFKNDKRAGAACVTMAARLAGIKQDLPFFMQILIYVKEASDYMESHAGTLGMLMLTQDNLENNLRVRVSVPVFAYSDNRR